MRLLIIDADGSPLVNTTINIASQHPDPVFSFKESNCALSNPLLTHGPDFLLSKLQIVLSYLGSACLSRLVERLNSAFSDPRYHRSIMEEQALANELSLALKHINNAYKRVKPYSTPAANALAKVCNDLNGVHHKILDGENDPFANLNADLAPRNGLLGPDIPQPEGLAKTFFRQRPKESWVETFGRVFSEGGWHSLLELESTDAGAAELAAREAIRMRSALQAFDSSLLHTIAGTGPALPDVSLPNAPRANILTGLTTTRDKGRTFENPLSRDSIPSPLNAEAPPFKPAARAPLFASIDGLSRSGSDSSSDTPARFNRLQNPFSPARRPGLPESLFQHGLGNSKVNHSPMPRGFGIQPPKLSAFAPIGHERARSIKLSAAPAGKNKIQSPVRLLSPPMDTPESWEDEISMDDLANSPPSDQHTSTEENVPTPRVAGATGRGQSPQFEVNGPDSPTYKTWAQKAASAADEEAGWETVEKGKRAAQPMAKKEVIHPQSIDHKKPRYVLITGLRANTSLSEVTAQIETGPLISVALEKSSSHNGLDARVLFIYGSNAVDFLGNEQYSKSARGESLYGPGVSISLGGTYTGSQADLRGMTVALNQAGRSDAGAHFERRRLTFSGNGMGLTEQKLRHMFSKFAHIPASDIEAIIVFNPGNATAILANVFSARKIKAAVSSKHSGEWKHCKVMYSSDPCEKHLAFMDKILKDKQADRADVVRRAYQKAGKVNC